MTEDLLEELWRYRNEGVWIDFKTTQYMLERAGDTEEHQFKRKKSELLKDVLALANAWYEGDRYILIGFQENKPELPTVVGLADNEFSDDAKLQQFIASNLKRRLNFSYEILPFLGKTVAVLTIPGGQARPFFAINDYGVVKRHTVYVRHGSSTAEADPEEVAKMGTADARGATVHTDVHVELAAGNVSLAGAQFQTTELDFGELRDLDDFEPSLSEAERTINRPNRHFFRELAKRWRGEWRSLAVKVSVLNDSEHALSECKIEIRVKTSACATVAMYEESELPRVPERWLSMGFTMPSMPHIALERTSSLEVVGREAASQVGVVGLPRVLAGDHVNAPQKLLLVPSGSGRITLGIRLLAKELKRPKETECAFQVDVENLVVDLKAFYAQCVIKPRDSG